MKRSNGINLDSSPIDQPQGTTRLVTNAIIDRDMSDLRAEGGTNLVADVPRGHVIIGELLLADNSKVLFSTDNSDSEIGLLSSLGEYTTIISDNILNFKTSNMIDATYVVNSNKESIIVWTDNLNPIRRYNITSNVPITTESDISLIPITDTFLQTDLVSINNSGGVLETGSYFIAASIEDSEGTSTNYSEIIGPIMINDENYGGTISEIDGGAGGILTSKSVTILLSNIDTDYSKVRVAIIPYQNGNLLTVKTNTFNITGTTLEITITGNEPGDASIENVIIDSVLYERAKTLTQLDSRIYFGNLTAKEAELQSITNSIVVEFDTDVLTNDNTNSGFKNPENMLLLRTFQRDEVYALYASYVYSNYSESRLFHIPGRTAIDTPVPGIVETGQVTDFLGTSFDAAAQSILAFDPSAKIFQYFNFPDSNNSGFWENSNELYPNTSEWGALANTAVRHHRVPSPETVPLSRWPNQDSGQVIGVKFSNLNIPSDAVGIKFYAAKRTDNNSLVVDSMLSGSAVTLPVTDGTALTANALWAGKRTGGGIIGNNIEKDILCGLPPAIMSGTVSSESIAYIQNFSELNQPSADYNVLDASSWSKGTRRSFNNVPWTNMMPLNDRIRGVLKTTRVNYNEEKDTSADFYGKWGLKDEIDGQSQLLVKLDSDINKVTSPDSDLINMNATDTFLTYMYRGLKDLYQGFSNQEVFYLGSTVSGNTVSESFYSGDCLVSYYTYRTFLIDEFSDSASQLYKPYTQITTWYEGRVNLNLRQEGTLTNEIYYPKTGDTTKFLPSSSAEPERFPEHYSINTDYNLSNSLKQGIIYLDDEEDTSFNTRITRSQKYEGIGDNYRLLLPNDYIDLQRNRGDLWNLESVNNVIVPHLERAIVLTKGKEQLQINDLSTAYLGSGDIFSVKPDEILMTEEGYGGTRSQFASVVCSYGYFFVDTQARKVYVYSGKLNEISNSGMSNWFEENLKFGLAPYGHKMLDTPSDLMGIHAGYDNYNKRVLLTKLDYKPTDLFITQFNETDGQNPRVRYNESRNEFDYYAPGLEEPVPLEFTNTLYFERNDWTISYSFEKQAWVSFHDYHPNIYIKDLNNYLSGYLESVWEHDIQVLMGANYTDTEKVKFIVEFVDNFNNNEFYTSSFDIVTTCLNQQGGKELYSTFDSFVVYNSFQCSGETDLTHLDTARSLRDTWVVNRFRDLTANPSLPVLNKDLSINTDNVNVLTPWHERRKFIDNYVVIRLIFDNSNNNLLFLHSAQANIKKSFR